MLKIFLLLLLFLNFLNADIITNVSLLDEKNKCIYNDYYNSGGYFYYHYVSDDSNNSTRSTNYTSTIISGYKYDTDSDECILEEWLILGMDVKDWHFLEALTGLLFGFYFLVSITYIFITVGGKR